jgi:hypothetical protein
MRDPISSPVELVFFIVCLAALVWIALDTRRCLEFLFPSAKPISEGRIRLLRMLSAFCACGVFVLLASHVLRSL